METTKKLSELDIGDLFSLKKNSAVHMVVRNNNSICEYKSYEDGKIRTLGNYRIVYLRPEYDAFYESRWFKTLD